MIYSPDLATIRKQLEDMEKRLEAAKVSLQTEKAVYHARWEEIERVIQESEEEVAQIKGLLDLFEEFDT